MGMVEIELSLDGEETLFLIPDGEQRVRVELNRCECGCKKFFQPTTPHQRFLNPEHERLFHNSRRRKNPERPYKKRIP